VVVAGTPAALVGWLSGRTPGSGLSAGDGGLPDLPPL
jgi:maleylpyruvate isomerase